jgi:hypothetical protein
VSAKSDFDPSKQLREFLPTIDGYLEHGALDGSFEYQRAMWWFKKADKIPQPDGGVRLEWTL